MTDSPEGVRRPIVHDIVSDAASIEAGVSAAEGPCRASPPSAAPRSSSPEAAA